MTRSDVLILLVVLLLSAVILCGVAMAAGSSTDPTPASAAVRCERFCAPLNVETYEAGFGTGIYHPRVCKCGSFFENAEAKR